MFAEFMLSGYSSTWRSLWMMQKMRPLKMNGCCKKTYIYLTQVCICLFELISNQSGVIILWNTWIFLWIQEGCHDILISFIDIHILITYMDLKHFFKSGELRPYGEISVCSPLKAQICSSPFSGNFWSTSMFRHGGKWNLGRKSKPWAIISISSCDDVGF